MIFRKFEVQRVVIENIGADTGSNPGPEGIDYRPTRPGAGDAAAPQGHGIEVRNGIAANSVPDVLEGCIVVGRDAPQPLVVGGVTAVADIDIVDTDAPGLSVV